MHRGSVRSLEGRSSKSWLDRDRASFQKKWKDDSYVSRIIRKMESPEEVASRRKSVDEVIDGRKTLKNEKTIGELLDRYSKEIDDHFFVVEEEVMTAVEEEKKDSEDDKEKMTVEINDEAEREIAEIRKRRDERLKRNEEKCEKTGHVIEQKRHELLMQLHNLGENVRESMEHLKTKHHGSSAAKANANIDQLLSKFDNNGEVDKPVHDGVKSTGIIGLADQVCEIANSVMFTRMKGKQIGEINGEKDRWVLEEKIKLGPVELPVLKGSISEDEVVIEDVKTSTIYVTNIRHKTTREVLKKPLFNCASRDGQIIVCGTREGHVALYDKSWKHIRSLRLPDKFRSGAKVMCVAVDDNGKILVAQYGSNHVHVYHPSGSQWLRTLDIDDSVPIHGIHVLPSGIAVHSAMYGEQVYIMDRDGNKTSTAFLEESESKCLSILAAYRGTDSLYNLFCESASGKCVVEEVIDVTSGKARIEKIIEFPAPPIANGLIGVEGFSIVQPDKIVTCDGDQILIYRKRLGVGHLGNVVS